MRQCSVMLLRPYETSYEAFMHDAAGEEGIHHNEALDEWVDDVTERIRSIAEECKVQIDLGELELRRQEEGDLLPLMSPKRRRMLQEAGMLVAFYPTPEVLTLVGSSVAHNPMQRGVIALERNRSPENLAPLLSSVNTPILGTATFVRRLFAARYGEESVMNLAVREALIFPDGRVFPQLANTREDLLKPVSERYIDEFGG